MKIGFIGTGVMGTPMAKNVLSAGHSLTIFARNPNKVHALVAQGAVLAETKQELAQKSEIIVTMLPNTPEVEEVVLGPEGILDTAHPDTIIIDMSTIDPEASRVLHLTCTQKDVHFLDAPVSGGSNGAEKGTLTIMVGGNREAFDRALPVLEAMGKKENIFYVGSSGAGEVIKLANNMLCGIIAAATAEALILGVKAGANIEDLHKIISVSTGQSWQLVNQFPARVYNRSFQPGFMTNLLHKDLGLALNLANQMHVPVPITSITRQLYEISRTAGYGTKDYTALTRLFEDWANVEIKC